MNNSSLCGQKRSFQEFSNQSTTPGGETSRDDHYDRQISEAEKLHMEPYFQEWIDNAHKHGIDESKLIKRSKTKDLNLSKVKCIMCQRIVSDTAVQCINAECGRLMCEACSLEKPCACKEDAVLVPLADCREVDDAFAELKLLEFKCVLSQKCKHSIKYEELYRLGPYKHRTKFEHFCEYLPLRCLKCHKITSDDLKYKHFN